ncbi:MAG TPA: hypothetical protein VM307_10505 [Egibacteraceae bacterium]|nr:hypothetical protein [Egibacteraceae bacterium]
MSGTVVRRLAVTVGVLAVLLFAADIALILISGGPTDEGGTVGAAMWTVGLAGAPVVGLLIAARRPDNRYGWLLLSFGFFGAAGSVAGHYAEYVYGAAGIHHPAAIPAAMVETVLWPMFPMHLPLLLLFFPDGRLPSPRWRWVPRIVVPCGLIAAALARWMPGELGLGTVTNPYAATGAASVVVQAIVFVAVITCFVGVVVAAVSLRTRRKRADELQRLQLRWFMWAAGMIAAVLVATGAGAFVPNEVVNSFLFSSTLLALFAAIGIAVTRYRLYEIDRVISRTVAYAAVTVVIVGVYLLCVTLITAVTSPVVGDSTLAIAASTLAAAAAFGPARRRIQAAVDRRFNRARYDAAVTAAAYRARLRDQLDLEAITHDLVATTNAALHPSATALWVRPPQVVR